MFLKEPIFLDSFPPSFKYVYNIRFLLIIGMFVCGCNRFIVLTITALVFYLGYYSGLHMSLQSVPCHAVLDKSAYDANLSTERQQNMPCPEFDTVTLTKSDGFHPPRVTQAVRLNDTKPICADLMNSRPVLYVLPTADEQRHSVPAFDPSHRNRVGNLKGEGTGGRTTILFPASSGLNKGSVNADIKKCTTITQHYGYNCFGVAFAKFSKDNTASTDKKGNSVAGLPVVRFDASVDENGLVIDGTNDNVVTRASAGTLEDQQMKGVGTWALNKNTVRPAGHFRRVPKERGFQRVLDKLGSFVKSFGAIRKMLNTKLSARGIKQGDDVVVLVVNEGEIDLFVNFACSCKLHGIDMRNVLVFAGSKEVMSLVDASDAISLYHPSFAEVSKKASVDYLDRVFVDMMWYKAFSTYLVLQAGINILFQDVDLVWFRDPFPYFKAFQANQTRDTAAGIPVRGRPVEAFFSDDGQRSKRYSPFFFNSGFYYLKATPRSVYFTWSIMTAFDAVQVTGSHQNVFTLRLVEGLGLGAQYTQMLPLYEFPNGILYHHNKKYMKQLYSQQVDPYHFHMCWTQGKPQKLEYMRTAHMWYLTESCSPLENLIAPKGKIYIDVLGMDAGGNRTRAEWKAARPSQTPANRYLTSQCCKGTGLSGRELH